MAAGLRNLERTGEGSGPESSASFGANPGDVQPRRAGVSELRINYGLDTGSTSEEGTRLKSSLWLAEKQSSQAKRTFDEALLLADNLRGAGEL